MRHDPLNRPIAALTDHAVLSAEDEATLIATLRAGVVAQAASSAAATTDPALLRQVALGAEARATLVRHNMRLVVSIAKRYLPSAGHAFTLDDLISLGCVGLLRGIDKFDPAKSHKLSTYATWWIRQAISRGMAEEGRVMTRSVGAKRYRPARPPPRPAAPAAPGAESAGPAARARTRPGGTGRPPGLVGGAGRPAGSSRTGDPLAQRPAPRR